MLKTLRILCVSLFCICFYNAQTHRFFYNVSYKKDSLAKDYVKESVILDIEKNDVKFYPYDFLVKDSIRIATGTYSYSNNKFNNQLIRNKNSEINTNYIALSPNYYSYETTDKQNWKIASETKKIDKFLVQKATTEYGGRKWEAWFCTEIPFQEGPYKFRGFPGLIIELKDTKENYIFRLVKTKNLSEKHDTSFYLERLNEEYPKKINEKSYRKLKLDYYQNPLKDFPNEEIIVKDKNGNFKTLKNKDVIKNAQKRIRKYNNPIEIDKAISYPIR